MKTNTEITNTDIDIDIKTQLNHVNTYLLMIHSELKNLNKTLETITNPETKAIKIQLLK